MKTVVETALPLAHAAATLYMTGIIWFVQLVQYPLFNRIGQERFAEYENNYTSRTGWVVGPAMLIELATAIALIYFQHNWVPWIGFALLTVIWGSTIFRQIPQHKRLEKGFDATTQQKLVRTNWIRTLAWSARAVIALIILETSKTA